MEAWILFITIGLFIIGGVALFVSIFDDSLIALVIATVFMLLGCILVGLDIYASVECDRQPWKQSEYPYVTHTIVVLSDGNEIDGKIRGSRYCMSGYINEKFTYVYGYKTAGGGMKIQKATDDKSTVYFNDEIEPCAKWYRWTREFWWVKEEKTTCDIYVPTDSLEASITIDLQ